MHSSPPPPPASSSFATPCCCLSQHCHPSFSCQSNNTLCRQPVSSSRSSSGLGLAPGPASVVHVNAWAGRFIQTHTHTSRYIHQCVCVYTLWPYYERSKLRVQSRNPSTPLAMLYAGNIIQIHIYLYVYMYKKLKRKQNIVDACEKQNNKKNTEYEKI